MFLKLAKVCKTGFKGVISGSSSRGGEEFRHVCGSSSCPICAGKVGSSLLSGDEDDGEAGFSSGETGSSLTGLMLGEGDGDGLPSSSSVVVSNLTWPLEFRFSSGRGIMLREWLRNAAAGAPALAAETLFSSFLTLGGARANLGAFSAGFAAEALALEAEGLPEGSG